MIKVITRNRTISVLEKDCNCTEHDGPHWLYEYHLAYLMVELTSMKALANKTPYNDESDLRFIQERFNWDKYMNNIEEFLSDWRIEVNRGEPSIFTDNKIPFNLFRLDIKVYK